MKRDTKRLMLSTLEGRELGSSCAVPDSVKGFQAFSLWISELFPARSFIRTNTPL